MTGAFPQRPAGRRAGCRSGCVPGTGCGRTIFGQRHLRTVLAEYEAHYNGRPHCSRHLRPPRPDHPVADLSKEQIQRLPVLGGLINEYERAA
jgi:putative transposase